MALLTRGFLTADEMGAGRDIPGEVFNYAQKGLENQLGRERVIAARAANEKNTADLEEQNRLKAEREEISNAFMGAKQLPAEAAPVEQAQVSPTQQFEPAVITPVPAQAPIQAQSIPPVDYRPTPQQIERYVAPTAPDMPMPRRYRGIEQGIQAPVQQTVTPEPAQAAPSVSTPAQPPAQPMPAPVQSAMPAAVPMPSAQQEVPTTVPAALPAASAPIEERQSFLRGTPEINGIKNPLADKTVSDRLNAIHQLYKDGKIRGNTAIQYVDALVENQNKQIDRALDLQTKFDEIQTSDLSATEKRLKVASVVRDAEDNKYFEVYQAALTDKNAAKMVASLNGIPEADVDNMDKIVQRAKRSPDYRATQNASLAQRKADLEARKVDVTLARQEARDATDQARLAQGDRRLDIAEARAAAADARASRAAGGSGSVTAPVEGSAVSGIKVDKQGNRAVDPGVAKSLKSTSDKAEYAVLVKDQLDALEKSKVLDKAPEGGIGSAIARAQTSVGYSGDLRNAAERLDRFKTFALGALNSPIMKGALSDSDVRRLLDSIVSTTSTSKQKKEAMNDLKVMIDGVIKTHSDAVGIYDDETTQKLKGLGVNVTPGVSDASKPAKPAKPAKPNVSGWKVTVSP